MPVGANQAFMQQSFAYGGGVMKPSKVPGKKSGPNGSFPTGDPKHARLAIPGATRSFRAGHISKSQEESIKASARRELGKSD